MTIPQQPITGPNDHLDFVVKITPPNDNTDGKDCPCGHAGADHQPLMGGPETSEPAWQCLRCTCTRANPARVPSKG